MTGRRALSILTLITLTAAIAPALAAVAPRGARPAGTPATRPAPPPVARVGPDAISRAELDGRTQVALAEFRQRNGNRALPPDMQDMLRRQILEQLIRMDLLALEAQRTGSTATADEAEAEIKKMPVFNPGGHFDAMRYGTIKGSQPDAFRATIVNVQRQLGARRMFTGLGEQFTPSEADSRADATRQMSTATVEHLSLRLSDFNGGYPEPRESAVLATYRGRQSQWLTPDRATITVAFVNSPGLTEAQGAVPGARQGWTARLRGVADSLVALMKSGTPYDAATAALGQRASIVVTADNFPGYWQGTPAQRARVMEARSAGKPILEPIAAAEGWLLVHVDEVVPAHVAPLREVAREIRATLRREQRLHHDEDEQRGLFAQLGDSLAAPGWPLRYAAVDTAALAIAPPDEAELDRWFRGHLADYSTFDTHSGAIVEKTLAEVHDDVRARYLRERRLQEGRALVDELLQAWSAGKRAPAAEARVTMRVTPPVVAGSVIDTGSVAQSLADTLWHTDGAPVGTGTAPWARGWLVWQVTGNATRVAPTFAQAQPLLAARLAQRHEAEELAGAHLAFAADSMRFNEGDVVHFTALVVNAPELLDVPLTHAEVEKYHHDHIDRYSAPELVTARHILVRPADGTPAADHAALARARDILARLRAGDDFAALAKQYSDDAATRDNGGDLGAFGHGTMLEPFERMAFKLNAGDLAPEPVRTALGYHVIKCIDHVSAYVTDLKLAYATVSSDAAQEKAQQIASDRADSLLRVAPGVAALRTAAGRLGCALRAMEWQVGKDMPNPARKALFADLVQLKKDQVRRPPVYVQGDGYWIAWVDSVTPPVAPTWSQAEAKALAEYRRGAGRRALEAKKAELDSMFAAGWSLDSVAALWAGPERVTGLAAGHGLPTMGNVAAFDSLVFGGRHSPGLAPGRDSGWLMLPQGWCRVRVAERNAPPEEQVAQRATLIRNAELERRLRTYFAGLQGRWPVKILDPTLRDVALVAPPPGARP